MARMAKYGVEFTFEAPIPKIDDTDFAATGDWTPAAGDVKVSKDGGNVANIGTLPAAVGGTGSVLWTWTLSATEMQAKRVTIQVVDAAVENTAFDVFTYGNASAQHVFDLGDADPTVDVTKWNGTAVASPAVAGIPQVNVSHVSGDSTAADNLEADYDDTGYAKANSSIGVATALGAQAKLDVNAEVDSALDTAVPGSPTANSINERVKAIDDKLPSGNLSDLTASAILSAIVEGSITIQGALRALLAESVGKLSGATTNNLKFRDTGDTKDRVDAVVDGAGNRTNVTLDLS